jgi:hypothetical protein
MNKEKFIWITKVNRFLYFTMNGGLCDFAFNFKDLANELSKYPEFNKFFNSLMNIIDTNSLSKIKENEDHTGIIKNIENLDQKTEYFFNEDAVCGMIKTVTLFKLCSDNIEYSIKLVKILLNEKYATNKMLGKSI